MRLLAILLAVIQFSFAFHAMADECLEKGMLDEAIRLYEGCLDGPHASDRRILFSCARAYFYSGDARHAEEVLARLEKAHPRFRGEEARLLQARVLEALGDTQRALAVYEELRDHYAGFEAKYRYAMLLEKSEQEWVKLARAERTAAGA